MSTTPQYPDPEIVPGTSRPIPVDPDQGEPETGPDPAEVLGPE